MTWNDFEAKEFTFAERDALIVYPSCDPIGRMLLKTEYLWAFPDFDIAMLKKGYYLIYISHRSRWAPDEETDIMAEFVCFCANELQASPKCVVEGMSCGGLQAARFGELYPELTAVLYLDAPVLNILSMVGLGECKVDDTKMFWREIVDTFGVSKSTIVNFRKSAIDHMEPLIKHKIPIIMVYGNADDIVIYAENGKVLEDYYKEKNGVMKVIKKSMGKHHPHGLKEPSLLVQFVEENYPHQNAQ